jgi:hypothetical protein
VAGEHEIEILHPRPQGVEGRQDGVFAAQPGVELLLAEGRERAEPAAERKPVGRDAARGEKSDIQAASGKLVAELQIAPDAAEDLDVRERRASFITPMVNAGRGK